MERSKDQPNEESKAYRVRGGSSEGAGRHHLHLAETQRQVEEQDSSTEEKEASVCLVEAAGMREPEAAR